MSSIAPLFRARNRRPAWEFESRTAGDRRQRPCGRHAIHASLNQSSPAGAPPSIRAGVIVFTSTGFTYCRWYVATVSLHPYRIGSNTEPISLSCPATSPIHSIFSFYVVCDRSIRELAHALVKTSKICIFKSRAPI
jgi:hypothetical protein